MLSKSYKYKAIQERFVEGKEWSETKIGTNFERIKNRSGQAGGIEDKQKYFEYYNKNYNALFESIKRDGILPSSDENPEILPVYVHIGRRGEILYTVDGNHRLFMAMILGIKSMPVRVWRRHSQWQRIRDEIIGKDSDKIKKEYKKYLSHPDIP